MAQSGETLAQGVQEVNLMTLALRAKWRLPADYTDQCRSEIWEGPLHVEGSCLLGSPAQPRDQPILEVHGLRRRLEALEVVT